MTPIESLIERLEKATGPDRELDSDICRACGFKLYPFDRPSNDTLAEAPRYTASLDAAVSLCERVLPGRDWTVRTRRAHPYQGNYQFEAVVWGPSGSHVGAQAGYHNSGTALALCLATLRARAAIAKETA